ncbi:MAG: hypothetical protein K2N51_15030 [Lachnospiraceae bacterium]|nr:hypothetical protein [Lachnospiraceae bacterium]
MVTITDGVRTFHVPAGATKPYEGMGFHVATNEELEEKKQVNFDDSGIPTSNAKKLVGKDFIDKQDKDSDEKDGVSAEDAAFVSELLEKPLSQWSNEEVKDFVKIKNIDTSGAQKVSQVRGIIKAYLEEEQKKNI